LSNEIQQNRYDQLVRRVTASIGPGSKVAETITELFPMIDVENLPAELYRLSGTRLCFGGGLINAVAGQSPRAMLFNPVDSGILVTVTQAELSTSSGTTTVRWGVRDVSLGGAVGSERFRDTREFTPDEPTAQVHLVASVTLAGATNQARNLNNVRFILEPRNSIAVLAPGTGFEMGLALQNATMHFGFYWRERTAEQSELNF